MSLDRFLRIASYLSQEYASANPRPKLYLILGCTSLILLSYSIWQIRPVIVEPADLLGLGSRLPPFYWAGLALILLGSILAFLDTQLKNDALSIFLLLVLGLFLFGIGVFPQEYPRDPGAYYPSGEAKIIMESHRVDVGRPIPSYMSWPAIHLTTASILEVSGVDLLELIRYFPLSWVIAFILIAYSIGKRLKLPPNLQFLLPFLALSSYWVMWSSYSPQSIGILLYLLLFMFMIVPGDTVAERISPLVIFGALLMTHSLAALTAILAVFALSIYRRQPNSIALFFALFLSWYMFQAWAMFEVGVSSWWSAPLRSILQMTRTLERATAVAPAGRMFLRYTQLSYLAIYLGGVIAAAATLWRGKVRKEEGKLFMSCLFWSAGILGLAVAPVGILATTAADVMARLYTFGLIAAACIVLLALRDRKLLVTLMTLLVALNVPAHYGAEAAWGQVLASEFKGLEFLALQVRPQQPYFYNDGDVQKLIFFHNPKLINVDYFTSGHYFPTPYEVDASVLRRASYIVIGKQGSDRAVWGYGVDALRSWLLTNPRENLELIYSNRDLEIYHNTGR